MVIVYGNEGETVYKHTTQVCFLREIHIPSMVKGIGYVREKGLAVARAERGSSYIHTCTYVYGHLLTFRYSAFTCSVNAVFNRMPLIH